MMHYDISQKLVMMFFAMFTINVLFTPDYFQQSASAYNEVPKYDGEIIFSESNNTVINTNQTVINTNQTVINTNQTVINTNQTVINTTHTIYMKPIQNINVNTN